MATATETEGLAIRADLEAAIERAWERLARPGTWWDGAGRMAIAAEARNAAGCTLCAERKQALSPYNVEGAHESLGALPEAVVEVIHRVCTDPGRLTESWYDQAISGGIAETEYVEIIGVVSTLTSLDTFARALGEVPRPLPPPLAGEPTRHRPAGARHQGSWVPTLEPGDVGPEDPEPYPHGGSANIHKAMSLVPEETAGFFDLVEALYMPGRAMRDFGKEYRAVTHAQSKLIAARISAINQCIY